MQLMEGHHVSPFQWTPGNAQDMGYARQSQPQGDAFYHPLVDCEPTLQMG